jgi:hypothetical protein
MDTSNPQRTDGRWPGGRSRPTWTRKRGRTRQVIAVLLLILLALIGGFFLLGVYGFAKTYGAFFFGSDLGEIARGLVVFVGVLIGVAALAVGVAREGTRHLVGIAAGVLVVASLLGLVLANHYGLAAKVGP